MNNIKLFMLLIMAATSSVAIAQETASYEFKKEDSGNTLVIEAKGDLTTYGTETTVVQFNSTAVNNVYVNDHGTSVTGGQTYQSAGTYYTKSGYKQIFSNGELENGDYLNNVTKSYTTWKDNANVENTTYIYPVTLTPKTLWKESTANVEGTYIYYAHIYTQEEWDASNVNLYAISGEPTTATTDIWKTSALTASGVYVYPVSYDSYAKWYSTGNKIYPISAITKTMTWDNTKTQAANVYIYKVREDWQWDGSLSTNVQKLIIGSQVTSGTPENGTINIDGTTYSCYYLSSTELQENTILIASENVANMLSSSQLENYCNVTKTVTISGGDISGQNVKDIWVGPIEESETTYASIIATTNTYNANDVVNVNDVTLVLEADRSNYQQNLLTITANRLTTGTYSAPGTFTHSNTSYLNYIRSSLEIASEVTYPISELNDYGITLLESMSEYHEEVTTTTVTLSSGRITTGTSPNVVDATYSYDYGSGSTDYVKYITLNDASLTIGSTVDITTTGFTPLTSIDDYRATKSLVHIDSYRKTSGEYTAPTYYYDKNNIVTGSNWYTYYVKSTVAKNYEDNVYLDDESITVLNEEQLAAYWETKTLVSGDYSNTPTAVTSGSNYSERSAITVGDDTYAGYVKLTTSTWPSTPVYAEDNTGIFMTQETLESTYLNYTYKFHVNKGVNVYSSSEGGNTLNSDAEYTLSNLPGLWADNFTAINDNDTYFGTGGTGAGYLTSTTTGYYFKDALLAEILKGSYTKVVFNNTTTDNTPLTINPEIVQQILFPNSNANNTITELDLGEATTTSFYCLLSHPIDTWKYPANLASCTLPLTTAVNGIMTLPPSSTETIGEEVKEIDVIPSIYLNKNLTTVTVPVGYTNIAASAFYGDSWLTTVNLPEGLTEIGDNAFENCTGLQYINNTSSRSIVFPSTLATIGESAFVGTSLTSTESDPFILPRGLKKVKKSAFQDLTNLEFLQLNENLEYVGNTAFGLNAATSKQATITFPSTLKYLGPGSFINRWYQDVYFTGKTAPVCPVGKPAYSDWGNVTAFSVNTQMGNNGFNPIGAESGSTVAEGSTAGDASKGYANRENYINNSAYYFTILHFPEGLTNDQAKTYRDITRRYVTGTFDATTGAFNYAGYGADIHDATDPNTKATYGSVFKEKVDGTVSSLVYYMSSGGLLNVYTNSAHVQPGFIDTYLGAQQIWPSQSQWIRNFVTVANGVEWDGVTVYEPAVTDDELQKMFEWMKEDGLYVQANSLDYTNGNPRVPNSNDNSQGGVEFSLANKADYASLSDHEKDYFKLILYQGTRRFVLSYDGGYSIPFKVKLKGGRWWSICLPFNMTKKEVDKVFGNRKAGTHVCLMSAVDRSVTNNSTDGNTLVLKFKNDVYRHKTEREVTKDATGYAYTYASNFSKSNTAPADDDIVIYARESYMIYPIRDDNDPVDYDFGTPVFETGDPLPTIVYSNSDAPYTTQHGTDPAYRFIGNFTTSTGNDNQGKAITIKIPQYSYAYGRENAQATQSKFFILEKAGATWSPFKSLVQNTAVDGGLNDWNNFFQQNAARVNQVSLFGDDEEVTGIDNVIIEVSSDNDEDLRVFNLNGSMMGNSLQGLPAGTYIQGGKAYRVK